MKHTPSPRRVGFRGMSLLELTVVIVVLLTLAVLLLIGARAWKRGSDRTGCLLSLRNFQVATRSYQNLYGYRFGDRLVASAGAATIPAVLFDKGFIGSGLYEQSVGAGPCPGGGGYTSGDPSVFPQAGELFLKCSLAASEDHAPETLGPNDW